MPTKLPELRLLVCGDRNWQDKTMICDVLVEIHLRRSSKFSIVLIHGAARGADSLAGQIGEELGWEVRSFPADWQRHGKAAGPIRNQLMLEQQPHEVLAFHDNIEQSKGTGDMLRRAKRAGITHYVISHSKKPTDDGPMGLPRLSSCRFLD